GPGGGDGPGLQSRVLGSGGPAHPRDPAHGGDPDRDRARVRDDVPPDARGRQLPPEPGRAPAVQVDLLQRDGPLRGRPGRRLAVDPAHHADRAGRPGEPAARAVRGRPHRRRLRAPGVPLHHPAAPAAGDRGRGAVPGDRRPQDLRHHLHPDPGRPRQRDRDHQHPALQPGVLVLQHGLRLVHGGRAVRAGDGRVARADQGPAERRVVAGRVRRRLQGAVYYGLALAFMLPTVFVFYWMITLSLKPQVEATAYPPSFFRFSVTTAGYRTVFTKYPFLLYTWNSLVVAVGCTALGLAVGLPAAYSIARWRQRGLAVTILVARIIPGISYLIPWYIFFRQLRMVDTYGALILTHLIVGLPIIIWVMIGFFEDVPRDLEDAALIDGCSHLGIFWRVALPLVRPGVMATAILSFVFSWNNFLFSVILAGRETRTLPIAVFNMISYEEINWGTLAAAATMITLPVLLLALLVQRHIVTGLTFGAVKQ